MKTPGERADAAISTFKDLAALTRTMTPEELRGAIHCLLRCNNEHGMKTDNASLATLTAVLDLLANQLFDGTGVSHAACEAFMATAQRLSDITHGVES